MLRTYTMAYYRFCSRLPELEEVIVVVYQREEDEGSEDERDEKRNEALLAHPGYTGWPIWSSWMSRGPERGVSAEEAAVLTEMNRGYNDNLLVWLERQVRRIQQKYLRELEEIASKIVGLTALVRQVSATDYGAASEYIQQIILAVAESKLARLTNDTKTYQTRLQECHNLLSTYCLQEEL